MYNKTSRTDRKFNKSREWLYEEYVVKNRKREDVAKDCGLTVAGLKNTLDKYGIYKPKFEVPVNELKQYLEEGKSVEEISKIMNCSETSIYRRMKANSLTIHYKPDFRQYDNTNDKQICDLYSKGLTPKEIGQILNISGPSVRIHLKHCGIHIRSYVEAQFNSLGKDIPEDLLNYDKVYNLYINQKLSKKDLGLKYNVDPGTIDRILKEFDIHVRTNSESKIGQNVGEAHHNWQGGITSLYDRLREAFQVQLIPKVLKRDNYTCQICGSKENLCVHHIRPFVDIVNEIVSEHLEYDIKENVNELYNIAVKDSRFTDLDNLITCCRDCHLYKLHGYKRNKVS